MQQLVSGGCLLHDSAGLRFSRVKWKYTQQKIMGGSGGNTTGGWIYRLIASMNQNNDPLRSGDTGDRARAKKGITCMYTAQDAKTREWPYRCWIGLNLKTGESIPTSSC